MEPWEEASRFELEPDHSWLGEPDEAERRGIALIRRAIERLKAIRKRHE